MSARSILEEIRKELKPLNDQVINHKILEDARLGKLKLDVIKKFVINQWYIVNYDLRSLCLGASRTSTLEELKIFKQLIDGDFQALNELVKLMNELGLSITDPLAYGEVTSEAVSYTHYISWLANYSSPPEFLFAGIVNLPVWGIAVTKFGNALREKYGIRNLGFFEVFKGPYEPLEEEVLKVIEGKIEKERVRKISRIIQDYEKKFWDSIYSDK
ncbi:MAG: TenA family transcriptional regulator [Sulfolobaceae archaeon]